MRKSARVWIFITLMLSFAIVFCAALTVSGKESLQETEKESWYREKETELLAGVRAHLRESGFKDSGVTLTRVVDAEGGRSYTFLIHHRRIDRMTEKEREDLRENLADLTTHFSEEFPKGKCTFQYEFLLL